MKKEQLDEGSTFDINNHRIFLNPSWQLVKRLLNDLKGHKIRLSVDKANGDVYVWDAMSMSHDQFKSYSGFNLLDMELTNGRGGVHIRLHDNRIIMGVDFSPAKFLIKLLPKSNKRIQKWVEKLDIET